MQWAKTVGWLGWEIQAWGGNEGQWETRDEKLDAFGYSDLLELSQLHCCQVILKFRCEVKEGKKVLRTKLYWKWRGKNQPEVSLKLLMCVWLPRGGDLSLNSPIRAVSHGRNPSADAGWGSTLSLWLVGQLGGFIKLGCQTTCEDLVTYMLIKSWWKAKLFLPSNPSDLL